MLDIFLKEEKKIIIFGTGSASRGFINDCNLEITHFVDNDINNQGQQLHNINIESADLLKNIDKNEYFIIIASQYYEEIKEQLNDLGYKEYEDYISYKFAKDSYEKILPKATYAPWNTDLEFLCTYEVIRHNTLVDKYRCFELWSLVEQVSNLEGDILEVGVWRGGSGALIAKKAQLLHDPASIYLCDTFTGVVKAGEKDNFYKGGEHSDTNIESVEALIEMLNLENVNILQGIFPDDTSTQLQNVKIKYCHIDVDVYDSANDIVEWVLERMPVGGVIVFDDYGFKVCDGITKLVNELKCNKDLFFTHNLNGHAVLVKLK